MKQERGAFIGYFHLCLPPLLLNFPFLENTHAFVYPGCPQDLYTSLSLLPPRTLPLSSLVSEAEIIILGSYLYALTGHN